MTAKDYLGQELNVDDIVFAYELQYRNPILARVIKVTPKMVKLISVGELGNRSSHNEFKQFHDQVLNVSDKVK